MSVHINSAGDASLVGYVSTRPGDTDDALEQISFLLVKKCRTICVDSVQADGPELTRTLEALGSGQTLVVTQLCRLGRSIGLLLELIDRLRADGKHICSLDDQIDSATDATFAFVTALRASNIAVGRAITEQRFGNARPRTHDDGQDLVHLFAALAVSGDIPA